MRLSAVPTQVNHSIQSSLTCDPTCAAQRECRGAAWPCRRGNQVEDGSATGHDQSTLVFGTSHSCPSRRWTCRTCTSVESWSAPLWNLGMSESVTDSLELKFKCRGSTSRQCSCNSLTKDQPERLQQPSLKTTFSPFVYPYKWTPEQLQTETGLLLRVVRHKFVVKHSNYKMKCTAGILKSWCLDVHRKGVLPDRVPL